jgi:hypothetical protein
MTSPSHAPLAPVLTEYLAALAGQMGLELQDPRIESLREAVLANEELFAVIDGDERQPFEDPWDFVRTLRAGAETDGP